MNGTFSYSVHLMNHHGLNATVLKNYSRTSKRNKIRKEKREMRTAMKFDTRTTNWEKRKFFRKIFAHSICIQHISIHLQPSINSKCFYSGVVKVSILFFFSFSYLLIPLCCFIHLYNMIILISEKKTTYIT